MTQHPLTNNGNCSKPTLSRSFQSYMNVTEASMNTSYMQEWLNPRTHGYFRVVAARPELHLGNPDANASAHIDLLMRLDREVDPQLVVFPEMSLTGYTIEDYVSNDHMLDMVEQALGRLVYYSRSRSVIFIVGAPLRVDNVLVNAAIAICFGQIRAVWPKTHLPNYREFYDHRYFASADKLITREITLLGQTVPIGNDILLRLTEHPGVIIHAEVCEDGWVPNPPSTRAALAGATILCNLSASDFTVGKQLFRQKVLLEAQSARNIATMIYSSCGWGESTKDLVWDGDAYIAENGTMLTQAKRFKREAGYIVADVHPMRLLRERRTMNTYADGAVQQPPLRTVDINVKLYNSGTKTRVHPLLRHVSKHPFIPHNQQVRNERAAEIFEAQAMALAHRMMTAGSTNLFMGASGGSDSTLAMLVGIRALDILELPRENFHAIGMPGYGTTKRTRSNAEALATALGATYREYSIVEFCEVVFGVLGHPGPSQPDLAFENIQARHRTDFLFHLASMHGGLVLGTGDLSELSLGWCTYDGDHMSSYNPNASVPKTLIKVIIRWYAEHEGTEKTSAVLLDILDTPISPELLPTDDTGTEITQVTEENVGPYELHDFFIYYFNRFGAPPAEILFLAHTAFGDEYPLETIAKWLRVYLVRFVQNQFKRDVAPPSPKLGTVSYSPRGDLRLPADMGQNNPWRDELDRLIQELELVVDM